MACINPWVKNSANTLKIKALRLIKLPDKMGWLLFRSAETSAIRLMTERISTVRKGLEVHPKFCPNEGTHRSRLQEGYFKDENNK